VCRCDYILNHVGYAIRRIPEDDIEGTLKMYEELLREAAVDDLMAGDVRGEVDATSFSEKRVPVFSAHPPTQPPTQPEAPTHPQLRLRPRR